MAHGVVEMNDDRFTTLVVQTHSKEKICLKEELLLRTQVDALMTSGGSNPIETNGKRQNRQSQGGWDGPQT